MLAPAYRRDIGITIRYTPSSRTLSTSMALSDANKNVAENVPRLILFAMLASVSCKPCFFSRSASSRYPTSARANSAFRNRLARSSHEGVCCHVLLPPVNNSYHIRYFPVDKHIIYDKLLPYKGVGRHEPPFAGPANPGDRLPDRGNEHPGNRAADGHSPGYDHAPWRSRRPWLRRAARPHHGRPARWPDRNGRTVGVRRQEAAPFEAHRQRGEGRPIHVHCLGLVIPRDYRLSDGQAERRDDGPIRSGFARAGDRCAGDFDGWFSAISTGDPRCDSRTAPTASSTRRSA